VQAKGFDNDRYLAEQSQAIRERVDRFGNKLYLEFGGKICFDYHAARVLPGYDPNVKVRLLQLLKDQAEVIFCVSARDLERGRMQGNLGITYDLATLTTIDDLRDWGLVTSAVVITRFANEGAAVALIRKLATRDVPAFTLPPIQGYPADVDLIVSPDGFGKNPYVPTTKPIVVVTGTGPGSGKMSTCLSQMYHDHQRGLPSGYAKFETFPIWDLPLDHPVNVAYEAATADLGDVNMIDPHHLAAYGKVVVNYNRDIESFPILKAMLDRISADGRDGVYRSPTDMGVNRAGTGIVDDVAVRAAACQEIIRRYFRYRWEHALGVERKETVDRVEMLMKQLGLKPSDRPVIEPARQAAVQAEAEGRGNKGLYCGAAIQLADGQVITGRNSPLLHAASAALLNAIKYLAGVPQEMHLLPTSVVENLARLKKDVLGSASESLNAEEILVALAISAATNPAAETGIRCLPRLRGTEMHMTHMPHHGDQAAIRRLGINLTTDALPTSSGYFMR